MCAAPGSKTAQIIECLHRDETNPIPSNSSTHSVLSTPDHFQVVLLLPMMSIINDVTHSSIKLND